MKTHIIFDLDGTLTDSQEGITNCVRYALESFGIHETDYSRLCLFIGPPLDASFKEFYGFPTRMLKKRSKNIGSGLKRSDYSKIGPMTGS